MAFGLFWTAFSSVFLIAGLWFSWDAASTLRWDVVPCVIERFEISADAKEDPPFRADLTYRYEVDGRKYSGTRVWPDQDGSDEYEELVEIRERFAHGPEGPLRELAGVAADCRVKPGEPGTSALVPESGAKVWFGVIFAVVGGLFVLIGIGLMKSERSGRRGKPAASSDAHPLLVVGFLLVFGCAGLGLLAGLVIPKASEWVAMRGWIETPARVIWSRVRSESDSDGTTYAVDLFYRYEVDGREHRSNRYDLLGGTSSGIKGKREVVRAHPRGSRFTVFVDPDRPWRAVVRRDPGWWGLFALFPLPFLGLGFGGLWWFFKKRRKSGFASKAANKREEA